MAKKDQVDAVSIEEGEGEVVAVDLSQVEDNAFELLPKGKYPAVITECEFDFSQNSGNPMWTMGLEVEGGDHDGHTLMMWLTWKGKGLPITKQTISRIAPELLENPVQPDDTATLESMVGKHVLADVTIRKYQDENRNNVRGLYANADAGDGEFV